MARLLRLANQAGRKVDRGIEIDFPISRQNIAEMTGTTLHTVSRILSAWGGGRRGKRPPARDLARRAPAYDDRRGSAGSALIVSRCGCSAQLGKKRFPLDPVRATGIFHGMKEDNGTPGTVHFVPQENPDGRRPPAHHIIDNLVCSHQYH